MKFRPDGLSQILADQYPGAKSVAEAFELAKKKTTKEDSERERRQEIWMETTERIQKLHGIRPQVKLTPQQQSKLNVVLKGLEKDILSHTQDEFNRLLEEWKTIWEDAIKVDSEND